MQTFFNVYNSKLLLICCRIKGSIRKRNKTKHKGRSIDPCQNSSPSSSSLSSPNETCYSFVRRALQKLAGGGRRVGVHRPWFLDSWSTCAKESSSPIKRYEPEGCECSECDNVQDMPIELRRIDDDEVPQRRQTFPSSTIINDLYSNLKSQSLSNIKTSGAPEMSQLENNAKPLLSKPRLVKQKKSVCDEETSDLQAVVGDSPNFKTFRMDHSRGSVFKQRSLNEELMSSARLREKERVRQNIQKQTSLNDEWIYRRQHTFDSFIKNSIFSVSTSNKFQLIKTGFANKLKNSTNNIEKVTSASLKNGFVRIFQNWKSSDVTNSMPVVQEDDSFTMKNKTSVTADEKKVEQCGEHKQSSREDGSDSSKDSSLQSDTSVDSEDSFASVIFVPKSETISPTSMSPGPTSPMLKTSSNFSSTRIKQSSCPTSPRIKQMPLTVFPLTKQLSSPKPTTQSLQAEDRGHLHTESTTEKRSLVHTKYSVPQIPKFKKTSLNSSENVESSDNRAERLRKIKELLMNQKPNFGTRNTNNSHFPIVRHSSINNGKVESVAKPLPKLMSLELFNPETDDKDSDSSVVSSPDSVDSVINVEGRFTFPDGENIKSARLFEAAADVANSLDNAVKKVMKSSSREKHRQLKAAEIKAVMERQYSINTVRVLKSNMSSWDDECHKHLTSFADKLNAKLLQEIDQYQENRRQETGFNKIDDPYINRLSEELQDLSKLSAEIQKQNEYLAKLSVNDSMIGVRCELCGVSACSCKRRKSNQDCLQNSAQLFEIDKCELKPLERVSKMSISKNSVKAGASTDSCDSERGK